MQFSSIILLIVSNMMTNKKEIEEDSSDLLWLDNQDFNEKDELKSFKDLTLRLFNDPTFGEKRENLRGNKRRYKSK